MNQPTPSTVHDPEPPATPGPRRWHGWVVWPVVVAALLPVLLTDLVGRAVLDGALDAQYFATYTSDAEGSTSVVVDPDVTFWQRLPVFWYAVPAGQALLASVFACVALAVLQFARRPAWLVPTRPARWAGAVVAWLAAASAATLLLLVLVAATRTPTEEEGWFSSGSWFVDRGATVAELLVVLALGVVAGAVLVRPGVPAPLEDPAPEDPAPEDPAPEDPAPEESEVVAPEPLVLVAQGFPRPLDDAPYRRPSA